ncbi:hypothetical protein [Corallococcus macrosporus]|uniref:CdiI immunity protein domain-containing protein n=1 Tax=Myxococcus fulvus (strain ATCC BAA-855 / HW-1) TaxID=483219 RepID=F8CBW4_MYXFH|nr:hypothetical protein [Corallococcus macrosporus]AEI65930.1 hypothetical protein LILAB_20140 [Corallococcus macrosporus]
MTRDETVIGECLRTAVEGPFFPDGELHTLLGLFREELAAVLEAWPTFHDVETQRDAVNGTLNNLLNHPHAEWASWPRYISAAPEEVAAVYERWWSANARAD